MRRDDLWWGNPLIDPGALDPSIAPDTGGGFAGPDIPTGVAAPASPAAGGYYDPFGGAGVVENPTAPEAPFDVITPPPPPVPAQLPSTVPTVISQSAQPTVIEAPPSVVSQAPQPTVITDPSGAQTIVLQTAPTGETIGAYLPHPTGRRAAAHHAGSHH